MKTIIKSIEPRYTIDKNNEIEIKEYHIVFEVRKKSISNGYNIKMSGEMNFIPSDDINILDLNSISGCILYRITNLME